MDFLVSLMVWARPTLVVLRSVTVELRVETVSALAETLELRLSALAERCGCGCLCRLGSLLSG